MARVPSIGFIAARTFRVVRVHDDFTYYIEAETIARPDGLTLDVPGFGRDSTDTFRNGRAGLWIWE